MSDEKWSEIRADYQSGMSLRTLAEKYDVPKSVIGRRKHNEQWDQAERRDKGTPLSTQKIPNRDINAAQRASMALSYRAKKLTYETIANLCGYGSASACRKAVLREMQRVIVSNVEELRREENLILDTLHGEMWEMAMDKSNDYRTFAVDRVLAISEARRKLLGLDLPVDAAMNANLVVVREVPQGYLGVEAPKP